MRMNYRKFLMLVATPALTISLLASFAIAIPIPIIGYDIYGTAESGTGLWAFNYTGTTTPTGEIINDVASGTFSLVDLTDGSGTLNDGVIGTTVSDTQLFLDGIATDGNSG